MSSLSDFHKAWVSIPLAGRILTVVILLATGMWAALLGVFLVYLISAPFRKKKQVPPKVEMVSSSSSHSEAKEMVKKIPKYHPSFVGETIGLFFTIPWAFIFFCVSIEEIVTGDYESLLVGLVCTALSCWGTFALIERKKRKQRIEQYIGFISQSSPIFLDDMTNIFQIDKKRLVKDLQCMIKYGWFGKEAYIDRSRGILFRSREEEMPFQQQEKKEEEIPHEDFLSSYRILLQDIRHANDRIPDTILSAKIARVEEVTGKIISEVGQHPEKQKQASTFFDYYLPTTKKLLEQYASFEEKGVTGENVRQTKQRIEQTMDLLLTHFEKQLDDLYHNEAMDVDSDIRVMESMLARDLSSAEQDFSFPKES